MSNSSSLATPSKCTADFCLIPMATSSPSVSTYIAEIQRLVKNSGVKYTMHSAGTTLEGPWDQVTALIGQAHTLLHEQGVVRIQTDIRIGTRTDKHQSAQDKVDAVNKLLAGDGQQQQQQSQVKVGDESADKDGDAARMEEVTGAKAEEVGAPLAS